MNIKDRYFIYKSSTDLNEEDLEKLESDYNCHFYDDDFYTKCFVLYCMVLRKTCAKKRISKKTKKEIANKLDALSNGFVPISYIETFNNL